MIEMILREKMELVAGIREFGHYGDLSNRSFKSQEPLG